MVLLAFVGDLNGTRELYARVSLGQVYEIKAMVLYWLTYLIDNFMIWTLVLGISGLMIVDHLP